MKVVNDVGKDEMNLRVLLLAPQSMDYKADSVISTKSKLDV